MTRPPGPAAPGAASPRRPDPRRPGRVRAPPAPPTRGAPRLCTAPASPPRLEAEGPRARDPSRDLPPGPHLLQRLRHQRGHDGPLHAALLLLLLPALLLPVLRVPLLRLGHCGRQHPPASSPRAAPRPPERKDPRAGAASVPAAHNKDGRLGIASETSGKAEGRGCSKRAAGGAGRGVDWVDAAVIGPGCSMQATNVVFVLSAYPGPANNWHLIWSSRLSLLLLSWTPRILLVLSRHRSCSVQTLMLGFSGTRSPLYTLLR